MSNFLYNTVDFLHTAATSESSPFSSNESDSEFLFLDMRKKSFLWRITYFYPYAF